jgi:hypothetical protein
MEEQVSAFLAAIARDLNCITDQDRSIRRRAFDTLTKRCVLATAGIRTADLSLPPCATVHTLAFRFPHLACASTDVKCRKKTTISGSNRRGCW